MQILSLDGARRIIRSNFFPTYRQSKDEFRYFALIGLGGNIYDTKKRFERFLYKLKKDRRFFLVETSIILENKAFGYEAQDDFLNSVILVQTSLHASQILKVMQHYENIFKRKRSFKNAPRTLDLDILYFSKKVRISKKLTVPHVGVDKRLSTLVPMGFMRGV